MSRTLNLARAPVALAALSFLWSACQQDVAAPSTGQPLATAAGQATGALAAARSTNGAAGQMPALLRR